MYIEGVFKLYVKNVKADRGELSKQNLNRYVGEEMQRFGSRVHCWVRLIKVIHWIDFSFFARISSNMCPYTNVELADIHFMEGNGTAARIMHMELFCVTCSRICQIDEHLAIFIGFCARVDYIMLTGKTRAVEVNCKFSAEQEVTLCTVDDSFSKSSKTVGSSLDGSHLFEHSNT